MRMFIKEFLRHPDIIVTSLVFLFGLAYTIPYLTSLETWLAFFLGMAGYAFSEYTIHRFFFHMKPPRSPFLLKLMKRLHYDHHVFPNELTLLFLPIWYSLPLIAVTALLVYLFTGLFAITISFTTGVVGFLLYYEWIHYVAHRPIKPYTAWGRYMKKIHVWHHYKNENFWYGVTSPVFDIAMGTFKDEKEVERSETARSLEKENISM